MDDDTRQYYLSHTGAGGVILVTVIDGESERHGVFSSLESAQEWAKRQDETCIWCPYVLNEPDWGNVGSN